MPLGGDIRVYEVPIKNSYGEPKNQKLICIINSKTKTVLYMSQYYTRKFANRAAITQTLVWRHKTQAPPKVYADTFFVDFIMTRRNVIVSDNTMTRKGHDNFIRNMKTADKMGWFVGVTANSGKDILWYDPDVSSTIDNWINYSETFDQYKHEYLYVISKTKFNEVI